MTVFFFTATGNSLQAARAFGGKLKSIPHCMKAGDLTCKDEAIGLAFPIYGFNPPLIVKRFLAAAQWEADYLFAIGTYGQMSGSAMRAVRKLGAKRGKRFDYTAAIKMVDNYLPGFEMADQLAKLPAKRVNAQLAEAAENVRIRWKGHERHGAGMGISTALMGAGMGAVMPGMAKKYIVNDNCVHCAICANVCPVDNINVDGGKPVFGGKCEFCLACAQLCPQNAIHLKNEKSAVRFRNETVTLADIIAANKQL